MQIIKRIEIRNFRSINNLVIGGDINNLNIFVGNNDVGKSNVLRALNLFFNHETDIGKSFNFEDDFNKTIVRTTGKGQYVRVTLDIELKYETGKYVRWSKKWSNKGELSEDIQVYLNDGSPSDWSRGSRAYSWMKNIHFRYVPAVKSAVYFQYLFEELHDLLNTSFGNLFAENTQALMLGVQQLTQGITDELNEYLKINNRITLPSDLRKFFGTLDFTMQNEAGAKFYLSSRGDGIKIRHIPIILKFMADKANTGRQGALNVQTIWGFEEPENNLEMTHAFEVAKYFHACSESIQIFITTHSPAFYSLHDKGSEISCFYVKRDKDDHTITINVKSENVDLDRVMGMLNYITPFLEIKNQQLQQTREENERLMAELRHSKHNKKVILFTEDSSNDLDMIKKYIEVQGLREDHVEYASYGGKTNFKSAVLAAKQIASQLPNILYFIFHRDRDCDGEDLEPELLQLLKRYDDRFILLLSEGYDLESNFINARHLNELYPTISVHQIEELIESAIIGCERKSLEKMINTLLPIKEAAQRKQNIKDGKHQNDINQYKIIEEVRELYFADKRRYMYGKAVLNALKVSMQRVIGQHVNPYQRSSHIVNETLKGIAAEIRQRHH